MLAKANSKLNFFVTEPFLESIPQCHVLLTILLASQKIPFRTDTYNEGVIEASYFFTATFLTSIFSATFGMTKLLKVIRNTLRSMANCTMGKRYLGKLWTISGNLRRSWVLFVAIYEFLVGQSKILKRWNKQQSPNKHTNYWQMVCILFFDFFSLTLEKFV